MQPMLPLLMDFLITSSTPVELFQISNICSSLWRLPFTNTSSLHLPDENLSQWLNEICWPSQSDWVEWGWLTPCPAQSMPLKDWSISPDCVVEQPSKREKREEVEKGDTKWTSTRHTGMAEPYLQRSVELAQEKGSSAWLTVLPVAEHGFHLHKGEFHDALCLRYGWNLSNTPPSCNCGTSFSVDHAMTCHMGGILTIHHNEIHDMLTNRCHLSDCTDSLNEMLWSKEVMSPVFMPGYLNMMTPAIDASEAYAKAALWQFWESALDKVDLDQSKRLHT